MRASVSDGLWAIPTLLVAAAIVLALLLLAADRRVESDGVISFGGGAEGARALLTAIAGSMITLTGLVFSITVVVLQLAANQYSPRLLRTFLRDTRSKLALGLFVATFASSVCISVVSATTLTVSVTAPAVSVTSTRAVAPAVSRTPSTVADWKPVNDASTRYTPGGKLAAL